jgi:hypothetical protein
MIKNGLKFIVLCLYFFLVTGLLSAQIPAGYYYNAQNKKKDELKTALHQIAVPERVLRYGSGEGYIWEGFYKCDRREDGSVVDMYSSITRYFDEFKSVSGMHIEHSFPKSWWGGGEWMAYKDLYHLYPSDGSINISKSNNPLGVVTGRTTSDNGVSKVGAATYPGYSGNVFEPADEFKGDFARSYFYVVTAYQDLAPYWNSPMLNKNTYPVWKPWAIELLKQWHEQDPVSIKEILRQEEVFKIQGNRNPFIDYPELVSYIWGNDTVNTFPFPVETEPFLVSPKNGSTIDCGVIMNGDSILQQVFVQGANINSNVNLSLSLNNQKFFLRTLSINKTEITTGLNINIAFKPVISGSFKDTLVIQGGGLTKPVKIILKGHASKDFMVLDAEEPTPVGAKLSWIADTRATDYKLTVYQGASSAGNLLFSSYVEGSGYNKAVEIYNGTGKAVDLSDYMLMKQSNGSGDFKVPYSLSGSLANNKTYLIAMNDSRNVLKTQADAVNDSVMSFNGNDAIALYHNGIMIDIIGYKDVGSSLMWGENKTLKRKSTVTHPSVQYDENQWDVYSIDYFDLLGSHAIAYPEIQPPVLNSVSSQNKPYFIVEGLNPESTYTYYVDMVKPDKTYKSVNTLQFTTTGLNAPEVNDADNITDTSFKANWEPDLYTNDYLIDVFQVSDEEEVIINEGFDNIGSNGKPLPEGWTGTASGRYTTATSSGIATPSLQLANTGEYVQTKEYPSVITQFSYMYRFASAAAGSYFKVEGNDNGQWIEIDSIGYLNTSKTTITYSFTSEDNYKSIRIVYTHKASGNIALDDFVIKYGNQSVDYVIQDHPVTGNEKLIESLSPNTDYYYTVKSVLGNSVSPSSERVKVTTQMSNALSSSNKDNIKLIHKGNSIIIMGLNGNEEISLYTTTGILLRYQKASQHNVEISNLKSDLYILSIRNQDNIFSIKVMK